MESLNKADQLKVKTQIVEKDENSKQNLGKINFKIELKTDKYKEVCRILNKHLNQKHLKSCTNIMQKMFSLVKNEVRIMEYAYNYLSLKEGYEIFISEDVKEEDFKKLKDLCYNLIELIGYFDVLNKKFKEVRYEDEKVNAELFKKLKNSAELFNEKYENLHSFVEEKIREKVNIKYDYLIDEEGKDVIPKIDYFKTQFGEEFFKRVFKILDGKLCEIFLNRGMNRGNKEILSF